MPKESKIDILKNIDKNELDEVLNTHKIHMGYCQRLVAMNLILEGHALKKWEKFQGFISSYQ